MYTLRCLIWIDIRKYDTTRFLEGQTLHKNPFQQSIWVWHCKIHTRNSTHVFIGFNILMIIILSSFHRCFVIPVPVDQQPVPGVGDNMVELQRISQAGHTNYSMQKVARKTSTLRRNIHFHFSYLRLAMLSRYCWSVVNNYLLEQQVF